MSNPNEPDFAERQAIESRINALRSIKSKQFSADLCWVPPTLSTEEAFFGPRVIRGIVPDDPPTTVELDDGHDDSQWGVRGCYYGKDSE